MNLRLDWCSYAAARLACRRWHYSRSMPGAKTVKIGVWENGRFIGVVIFSLGACPRINRPFNLSRFEVCELTRVALRQHETSVTKIIAIALKMLKRQSPGIRLVVSYADGNQGHVGKIYQAGNWIYIGEYAPERGIMIDGKIVHKRSVNAKYGTSKMAWLRSRIDPEARMIKGKAKFKYIMPLDKEIRKRVMSMSLPYPTCARSIEFDAPADQAGERRFESDPGAPELARC